jgi:LuxR family transcriptional regulator, maltose regulon positive regulatory protein
MRPAQQRLKDGAAQLMRLLKEAEAWQDHYHALRVTLQPAIASASANETAQAMTRFRRVVRKAGPAGISQTILEQEPPIGPLLLGIMDHFRGRAEDPGLLSYLQDLLSRWRGRFQSALPVTSVARAIGRRVGRLWPEGEVRGRTRIRYVQLSASSWSE